MNRAVGLPLGRAVFTGSLAELGLAFFLVVEDRVLGQGARGQIGPSGVAEKGAEKGFGSGGEGVHVQGGIPAAAAGAADYQ